MQAMRRISLVLVVFGGIASGLVGLVWLRGALRDTESAQLVEAANRSYGSRFGWYPFSALGDEEKARARIKSIVAVAAAINDGATFNTLRPEGRCSNASTDRPARLASRPSPQG